MREVEQSQSPCAVCACSPAWAFPQGPRCSEHYLVDFEDSGVPSSVLNIGSGEVQGSRATPSRQAPRNQPERNFQDRVIALLQLKGYRVHAERHARTAKGWVTPIQGTPGFPDIIAIREGHYRLPIATGANNDTVVGLAWELKAKGGKTTPEQVKWLRLFKLAGFDARVWHADEEDALINQVEEWT